VFFNHGPGENERMIFPTEGPWEEQEETAYENLLEYVEKNGVELPEIFDKRVCMRFLSANHHKVKVTVDNIIEHIEWREEIKPIVLNYNQRKLLDHGYLYIHGRDKCLRPICFSQAAVPTDLNMDMEEAFMTSWYVCFYMIDHLMEVGKVENWIFVSDLGGLSLRKIPTKSLKKFMVSAQSHLKCRVRMFYYFNVTFGLRAIWALISPFMDKFIKHKMVLRKDSIDPGLLAMAHPSQIEEKYGGEAENVTQFWPPYCPSEEYGVDEDLLDEPEHKGKSKSQKKNKKSNAKVAQISGDLSGSTSSTDDKVD
jgi:hypothetical protein